MFNKEDETFIDIAVDPARRLAAISDLAKRRSIMFWSAMITTLALLFTSLVRDSAGPILCCVAATHWMIVFKMGSDLRLLRVIERLKK